MPEGVFDEPNSGLFCVVLVPNENFGGSPPDMLSFVCPINVDVVRPRVLQGMRLLRFSLDVNVFEKLSR